PRSALGLLCRRSKPPTPPACLQHSAHWISEKPERSCPVPKPAIGPSLQQQQAQTQGRYFTVRYISTRMGRLLPMLSATAGSEREAKTASRSAYGVAYFG